VASLTLVYLHLGTILPAFLIGTFLLLNRKGTALHKALGRLYMGLMLFTAFVTLLISAQLGPSLLGHFGAIHLLSVLVLVTVPKAYFAARRGDLKSHQRSMIILYVAGLVTAGAFAFMPGRLLHTWLVL
jgi:uncharacterized membrane protein